ncbi:addiction module antidote protein [Lonepinella koalarum]|uniref:addiction module antidote protein n=1 Tax=Lonepinella koalarum TaxID=53417 RepID=UPI003F6DD54C
MLELQDFDIAEHLKSEEQIQLYLNEILQEDNVELILSALGDIARARNMSQIARDAGVTREGLYKALSGKGNPTFSTVLKVMKALNLRLEIKPNRFAQTALN